MWVGLCTGKAGKEEVWMGEGLVGEGGIKVG